MAFTIIQWNCQGIRAHQAEFRIHLMGLPELPQIICLQETWLHSEHVFKIPGYQPAIRRDRPNTSLKNCYGGVAILVKNGIQFTRNPVPPDTECLSINVIIQDSFYNITNYYQPGADFDSLRALESVFNLERHVVCGDFNAHSALWGHACSSVSTSHLREGRLLEQYLEEYDYICHNDGSPTYVGSGGVLSALDLTFSSQSIATQIEWDIIDDVFGSDHFPVKSIIGVQDTAWEPPTSSSDTPIKRWNHKKIDWGLFYCHVNRLIFRLKTDCSPLQLYNDIIEAFHDAAFQASPRKKSTNTVNKDKKYQKKMAPWWSEDCKSSIKAKHKALNKYRKHPTTENYLAYKRTRGQTKRVITQAKRLSWRKLCSKFNDRTNLTLVWNIIKSMDGRSVSDRPPVPPIVHNDVTYVTDQEKANLLASAFQSVSSSQNYTQTFLANKNNFEQTSDCPSNPSFTLPVNDNPINDPLTLIELKKCLASTTNTSPGQDGVTYKMLKQLDECSLSNLLICYNKIWQSGCLPPSWTHSIVTPVYKKNKPANTATSYRPIALTSCLCKLFEKIVTPRLIWFLDHHEKLNFYQSGFRQGRCTSDHLARLYHAANVQIHNQGVLKAIFVDLEKAFDMIWHDGLLYKLKKYGITGNMFEFISNFLHDRTFQVSLGSALSETLNLENGTPQGSVISPLLFAIMINDIPFNDDIEYALYADDCTIWAGGKQEVLINSSLQENLNILQNWCDHWGFKVSSSKTQGISFTFRRQLLPDQLYFDHQPITFSKKVKFLGITFDSKLTFKLHVKDIIQRAKKRFNIIRSLSGTTWGAGKETLRTVYRGLIRSLTDYAPFIYLNLTETLQKKLQVVQNTALRIICGAKFTSPVSALQVDAGELPLVNRWTLLNITYALKCTNAQSHPTAHVFTDNPKFTTKKKPKPFSIFLKEFNDNIPSPVTALHVPIHPPWRIPSMKVDTELHLSVGKETPTYLAKSRTLEHMEKWSGYFPVFTDGSKMEEKVAYGIYFKDVDVNIASRLSDNLTIFTAELFAIYQSLIYITGYKPQRCVIYSDSLSSLQAIVSLRPGLRPKLIQDIHYLIKHIQDDFNIDLWIVWIPAHVGISGNETADELAKTAIKFQDISQPIPLVIPEIKAVILSYLLSNWQLLWDTCITGEFYRQIVPTVSFDIKFSDTDRMLETTISRLRFNHNSLNANAYRVNGALSPLCSLCLVEEDTNHFLFDCQKYTDLQLETYIAFAERDIPYTLNNMLGEHRVATILAYEYILKTQRFCRGLGGV